MDTKRGDKPQTMKSYKKVVVRSLFILACALSLFALGAYVIEGLVSSSEIRSTKMMLNLAKAQINAFQTITGRHPDTLSEIREYADKNPGSKLSSRLFKEYLSDPSGKSEVHSSLNGKGGWYYDPNTGEVKVNLDKPVKEYLFYFGPERKEIPADW
ncbi:MAG: hypothetical protein ACYST6_15150 [Planctomycetota bacterium]|jgi:hypothetical protein